MASVVIQVVGWNHKRYLAACLRSCVDQSVPVKVVYIDNASQDGSSAFVEEMLPDVRVVVADRNLGYAGGHNLGFRVAPAPIVACVNPDVILDQFFIERALRLLTREPQIAAIAPHIFRYDARTLSPLDEVDSCGLFLRQNRVAGNIGEGDVAPKACESARDVFGVTGAAFMARRGALDDAAENGEIFDEDFFAYREDVDLSWRLLERGWRIHYAPEVRAYHVRRLKKSGGLAHFARPARVEVLSQRNYFLLLKKHETMATFVPDAFPIIARVLHAFGYMVLRPTVLPALWETVQLLPSMRKKRRMIAVRRTVSPAEIRKQFIR